MPENLYLPFSQLFHTRPASPSPQQGVKHVSKLIWDPHDQAICQLNNIMWPPLTPCRTEESFSQALPMYIAPKNWCFWTVVLEKTLESPLDCKAIQLVHPKGNQSQIFIGRTDAETPTLWPPDAKNWLSGKDPDAGKDWRQEKGTTGDEMVGWHHRLDGHEFEQTPGDVGDGQGSLEGCGPWGLEDLDTTE